MTNFKNFVVRKGLEVTESIKLNGKTVTSLIDSAGTTSLIDSSYVQARSSGNDSATTIALIDSSYVQARSSGNDSATTIALIDSSYVQTRQVDPVSAFTTISVTGQTDIVADGDGASPIWSQSNQQTKLVASDGATQHYFGQEIAVSQDGNTAIISAEQENTTATKSGAIYVFVRSGSTWTQQAKLKASDPGTENNLGRSLDISDDGNTVVAGAPFNGNTSAQSNIGAIYVWTRSGSTWSSATKIRGSDTTTSNLFGFGSSISGDGLTIAVGATSVKKGYIFVYSGGSWSQQAAIANPTGTTLNSDFGNKCALSQDGNTMVMTARHDHGALVDYDGAAYVFVRSGTSWSLQQKIQASVAEESFAKFGESCDISWDGNTIAIGCYKCDTNSGAVFVFTRSGSTWTQEQKIQPTDIAQQDLFAITVGISGDGNSIVAGSYNEDTAYGNAGALYAFSRSGTTWSQEIKLYASDAASNDEFGYGVAIAKDNGTVIGGARFEAASGVRSGSAYVFTAPLSSALRDTLSIEAGTGITITTNATTDTVTIAAAGLDSAGATSLVDSSYVQARQTKYTNADFTDSAYVTTQINSVIDAAPGALDTLNELAAALGDDANFSTTITNQIAGKLDSASTTALVDSSYVQARVTAAASGNDSATTIALIDSSYVQTRQVTPVSSFNTISVTGQTDVVADTTAVSWPLATEQQRLRNTDWYASDAFGSHMDMAGNYVIVGAHYYDESPYENNGAAFIFFRSGTTWTQQAKLTVSTSAHQYRMGTSVALNADATEAIVTINSSNVSGASVTVFTRSGTTWTEGQTIVSSGLAGSDPKWGTTGNISINGNHFIVGAKDDIGSSTTTDRWGSAWVYYKSGSTWGLQQELIASDVATVADANFGAYISMPTDSIVAIGAPGYDNSNGRVYIFERSGSTWTETHKISAPVDASTPKDFGAGVALDGDYLAIGASRINSNTGKVYIYKKVSGSWTSQTSVTASDAATGKYFGQGIQLKGDTLLVGAYAANTAYVFTRSGSTWTEVRKIVGTTLNGSGSTPTAIGGQFSDGLSLNSNTAFDDFIVGTSNQGVYVVTAGQSALYSDTLTFEAGTGITLTTNATTDTVTIGGTLAGLDSAQTTALVDSSYVQARVTAAASGNDSATTINLIDSDYVQSRQVTPVPAFTKVSIAGQGDVVADADAATGNWASSTQQVKLLASDAAAGDALGHSASISKDGTYAVAGAYNEDINGSNSGSAYIYIRSGTTWTQQAKIDPSDGQSDDYFGTSVDIDADGDTVVVGARKSSSNAGNVYIFTRSGTSWSQQAKLSRQGSSPNSFGTSVGITDDGNTVVVGSSGGSPTNSGYMAIYNRAGTSWAHAQTITASDAAAQDYLGLDVSISGDGNYVAAGSTEDNSGAGASSGSAYVFVKSGFNITSPTHDVEARMTGGGSASVNELEDPHGIAFNADGTKAFVVGTGGDTGDLVIQYSLSTAYDLNSITFDDVRFSVASQTTYPSGIFFKPDGTKMYISSSTDQASGTHAVFQYSLSTAFDLSTASYDSVSIDIRGASEGGVNRAFSIAFKPDGTKMFIVNKPYPVAGAVFEYHLSTPWDISSFSYDSNKSISTQTNAPAGIAFNTDGTQMFINATNSFIFLYNLTTGYDVSTASYSNTSIELSTTDNNTRGITFNPTGTKLYRCGASDDRVDQFSTTSFAQQAKLVSSDSQAYDKFGFSMSLDIDGNTLIVGAPEERPNSVISAGSCYIFTRSGTTWSQQAKLVSSINFLRGEFGHGVSISDDGNIAVGVAIRYQVNSVEVGSGFVFERVGSTWTETKQLLTSDTHGGKLAYERKALEISGNGLYFIAGVEGADAGGSNAGAAYVWNAPLGLMIQDTLTLEAGSNITLTTTAGTDTVTIAGSAAGLDSASTTALTTALIDSSYVQARQTKYTNADFTDSAYVTTQINSLIGGAPGTLDTLNEIAAALNDDDSAYSTLVGLISAKSDLDSSAAISLIDSDYVQARQEAAITQSATAPASPSSGDMWFDTNDASLLVYYTDSDGAQWVDISGSTGPTGATGAAGPTGATGTVANATQSDTAPSSPAAGDLWFDTTDATLFVYYTDSDGSQWVTVSGPAGATGATGAVGPAGVNWQSSIITDSAVNVSAGNGYFIDTTSNIVTASLPATASVGNAITFVDYARNWNTNNFQIHSANGTKLQAETDSDTAYTLDGQSLQLIYSGDSQGWIPISDDAVAKLANTPAPPGTFDFLVVGGGGGGGGWTGAGAGAGGYRTSTQTVSAVNVTITVTVGAGGTAGIHGGSQSRGVNGGASQISGSGFTTIASAGGGGGGGYTSNSKETGADGGSGGGAGHRSTSPGSGNVPSTSPSQGNDGGDGSSQSYNMGGGGGAGAVGNDGYNNASGGEGGIGVANNITGASVYYAGGGSGALQSNRSPQGFNPAPAGGGGRGGAYGGAAGTAGTPNTGGGGGGHRDVNGYAGGSGIVIIRVPTSQYSGTTSGSPTVTTNGNNTIIKFTASGSYTT